MLRICARVHLWRRLVTRGYHGWRCMRVTIATQVHPGAVYLRLGFVSYIEMYSVWYTKYNTIQYNTIQYNTIQYNTIQYNTIQYNTIQYNTIQYNKTHKHCAAQIQKYQFWRASGTLRPRRPLTGCKSSPRSSTCSRCTRTRARNWRSWLSLY